MVEDACPKLREALNSCQQYSLDEKLVNQLNRRIAWAGINTWQGDRCRRVRTDSSTVNWELKRSLLITPTMNEHFIRNTNFCKECNSTRILLNSTIIVISSHTAIVCTVNSKLGIIVCSSTTSTECCILSCSHKSVQLCSSKTIACWHRNWIQTNSRANFNTVTC